MADKPITNPNSMGIAQNWQRYAGVMQGMGAVSGFAGDITDYSMLNFKAMQARIQYLL